MQRTSRHAFTLIELLVVIAIIAILAAILFPVFAQAREKARQASCTSNNKQASLATLQYVQDYDETFPMAFGWWPSLGYLNKYNRGVPNTIFANQGVVQAMGEDFTNAIQPYTKNYQIMACPSGAKTFTIYNVPGNIVKVTYTYNGLLQSWPIAGVVSPASVPMLTEGLGRVSLLNGEIANPELFCPEDNVPGCRYVPSAAGCSSSKNGQTSGMYQMLDTAGTHGRGQIFTYTDGHVKLKNLSLSTLAPTGRTDFRVEPYVAYDANGVPPPGYFWTDGCHAYYFKPDLNLNQ